MAGILTTGVGALIVAVLGTGTVALMPRAAWLRHWVYPGLHLTAAAVHSRELTASKGPDGVQGEATAGLTGGVGVPAGTR